MLSADKARQAKAIGVLRCHLMYLPFVIERESAARQVDFGPDTKPSKGDWHVLSLI
jgi:hypothetical protein